VGAILSEQHLIPPADESRAQPAQELILQIDGHIPIQDKGKRSFEALSAIVYRPESKWLINIIEIANKTCAIERQR